MPIRTASARWAGQPHRGFRHDPHRQGRIPGELLSFKSRFEEGEGTNPEELIGAAHAGCFSMALSKGLGRRRLPADSVETTAKVHLDKTDAGMTVTRIDLDTVGDVPGIDEADVPEDRRGRQGELPDLPAALARRRDQPLRSPDALPLRPPSRSLPAGPAAAIWTPPRCRCAGRCQIGAGARPGRRHNGRRAGRDEPGTLRGTGRRGARRGARRAARPDEQRGDPGRGRPAAGRARPARPVRGVRAHRPRLGLRRRAARPDHHLPQPDPAHLRHRGRRRRRGGDHRRARDRPPLRHRRRSGCTSWAGAEPRRAVGLSTCCCRRCAPTLSGGHPLNRRTLHMRSELFSAENLEKESAQPGLRLQNSKMLKVELNGECMARTGVDGRLPGPGAVPGARLRRRRQVPQAEADRRGRAADEGHRPGRRLPRRPRPPTSTSSTWSRATRCPSTAPTCWPSTRPCSTTSRWCRAWA